MNQMVSEVLLSLQRTAECLMKGVHTVTECAEKLVVSKTITLLPDRIQKEAMVRSMTSADKLRTFLHSYESAEGCLFNDIKPSKNNSSSIICFSCGKTGHKSTECRSNRQSQQQQRLPTSSEKPQVTCFSCGELGHISRDCTRKQQRMIPTRASGRRWQGYFPLVPTLITQWVKQTH